MLSNNPSQLFHRGQKTLVIITQTCVAPKVANFINQAKYQI